MEEEEALTIQQELELVIIQLQEEKFRLFETVRALEAEIQRLNRIAQY